MPKDKIEKENWETELEGFYSFFSGLPQNKEKNSVIEYEKYVLKVIKANRKQVTLQTLQELEKKIEKPITEADGWDMLGESCCPGDDFADGWNKCRKSVLAIIKAKKEREK